MLRLKFMYESPKREGGKDSVLMSVNVALLLVQSSSNPHLGVSQTQRCRYLPYRINSRVHHTKRYLISYRGTKLRSNPSRSAYQPSNRLSEFFNESTQSFVEWSTVAIDCAHQTFQSHTPLYFVLLPFHCFHAFLHTICKSNCYGTHLCIYIVNMDLYLFIFQAVWTRGLEKLGL